MHSASASVPDHTGPTTERSDLNKKIVTRVGCPSLAARATFAAAACLSFSVGTAHADVEEVAPSPQVTSRQALIVSDNALRASAQGQARGLESTRSGDPGMVHAQGEVRDGVKAVTGTIAAPFGVEQNGAFVTGAPIGDW